MEVFFPPLAFDPDCTGTVLSGGAYWLLFSHVEFVVVTSPNRTQTKVFGVMVAVATVTGEVVPATALTFAAFFSDLSVVPGLIQSSYPSSEWMDASVVRRDHKRMRSTNVLCLRYFDINGHPELSFCYFSHFHFYFCSLSWFLYHSLSQLPHPAVHVSVLQRAICDCAWPWALHASCCIGELCILDCCINYAISDEEITSCGS